MDLQQSNRYIEEDGGLMRHSDAIKKMISDYILIQAETAISIGIIGSIFAGEQKITYQYFFLPALIGLICMLPCIVTYFKEDMTIKQIIIQRAVEWIVLEAAIIGVIYYIAGDAPGKAGYIAMIFSITFFDIVTYAFSYYLEKREADAVNKKLRENSLKRSADGYE